MIHDPILSLGVIFIAGFFGGRFVRKFKIPSITAYVALGILLSPDLFNIISGELLSASEVFSDIVLGMIAFILGESFYLGNIRQVGRSVVNISINASLVPWVLVTVGLWYFFRLPFAVALVYGAIASSTDPAGTVTVAQEYRSKGEFTDTLLGVVAIDDAWGLIIFGFSLSMATSLLGGVPSFIGIFTDLGKAFFDIIASALVGLSATLLFNRISHLINSAKDRLIYTFAFLFLTIGIAITLHLSVLLSCMVFGATLANTNKMSFTFFESLREVDSPFYIIFFVLAGVGLSFKGIGVALGISAAFILLRTFGKIFGAFIGAKAAGSGGIMQRYMGIALLPQAGVAIACALVAKHNLNNVWGDQILNVTIATTVLFELIGPWITKVALVKAGEIREL
ncbi:MAG: cation:proton antiporter [Candidatus Omnitrophica bacterium]|nr:cation:proton antiporter [Candidatus Omnitrophota bacterium]